MRWQYFGNATDIGRDNKEATASGFKDGNAEGLSERGVEEDVTPAEDISDLVVLETTKELNSLAKVVLLDKLL